MQLDVQKWSRSWGPQKNLFSQGWKNPHIHLSWRASTCRRSRNFECCPCKLSNSKYKLWNRSLLAKNHYILFWSCECHISRTKVYVTGSYTTSKYATHLHHFCSRHMEISTHCPGRQHSLDMTIRSPSFSTSFHDQGSRPPRNLTRSHRCHYVSAGTRNPLSR